MYIFQNLLDYKCAPTSFFVIRNNFLVVDKSRQARPRMARVVTDQKLAQLQIFVTSNNKIVEIFSTVIAGLVEFSQKTSNQSCHHK